MSDAEKIAEIKRLLGPERDLDTLNCFSEAFGRESLAREIRRILES